MALKVLVVGRLVEGALETSYSRALENLGCTVHSWDMPASIDSHTKFGRIGSLINRFWPAEAWVVKANRKLLIETMALRPDIILVFGSAHLLAGTIGQIKATSPSCRVVLVWPDSLLYCYSWTLSAIRAYDLVATYSRATIDSFLRLGAQTAAWVPLGFDPALHPAEPMADETSSSWECDVSFVGNHTPERERTILRLVADGFKVKVWGAVDWERFTTDRAALKRYWQGRPVFGRDFCAAVRIPKVSLNPINTVTWPAANMRFFEIPGCGGVSVSTRSPELESDFPDRECCRYYNDENDVASVVRQVLDDPCERVRISSRGREVVTASHTYTNRARQVLSLLGFEKSAAAEEGQPAS